MCKDVEECMEAGQETSRKEEIWHCSGCVWGQSGRRPRDDLPQCSAYPR